MCITYETHGAIMVSTQLNIRTSPVLISELDTIVKNGMFRNRTEAVNEALRLLVRRYSVMKIANKIEEMAESSDVDKNITDALIEAREEGD